MPSSLCRLAHLAVMRSAQALVCCPAALEVAARLGVSQLEGLSTRRQCDGQLGQALLRAGLLAREELQDALPGAQEVGVEAPVGGLWPPSIGVDV